MNIEALLATVSPAPPANRPKAATSAEVGAGDVAWLAALLEAFGQYLAPTGPTPDPSGEALPAARPAAQGGRGLPASLTEVMTALQPLLSQLNGAHGLTGVDEPGVAIDGPTGEVDGDDPAALVARPGVAEAGLLPAGASLPSAAVAAAENALPAAAPVAGQAPATTATEPVAAPAGDAVWAGTGPDLADTWLHAGRGAPSLFEGAAAGGPRTPAGTQSQPFPQPVTADSAANAAPPAPAAPEAPAAVRPGLTFEPAAPAPNATVSAAAEAAEPVARVAAKAADAPAEPSALAGQPTAPSLTATPSLTVEAPAVRATPNLPDVPALHQIVNAVKLITHQGETEVRLHLQPESLGRVLVQLHTAGTDVSIRLWAETGHAQALIQDHLPQLKAALAAQGLQVEDLFVAVGGDPSAFEAPDRGPGDWSQPSTRRQAGLDQAALDEAGGVAGASPLSRSGGDGHRIDYQV